MAGGREGQVKVFARHQLFPRYFTVVLYFPCLAVSDAFVTILSMLNRTHPHTHTYTPVYSLSLCTLSMKLFSLC